MKHVKTVTVVPAKAAVPNILKKLGSITYPYRVEPVKG
jgi:hypothetical protein